MEYKEEDFLMLSGIQHFFFCRRQWALIHIENLWCENALTAEGNIIHERVHETDNTDTRNGILTIRGLDIKSSSLGIRGCCDAVEFIPENVGITLFGRKGHWRVRPVEYKHGSSKVSDCDRLQTAAQAMCLEEMFCCEINEAAIFYHKTRRREYFNIDDNIRSKVKKITEEMHDLYKRGYTPVVSAGKSCVSCSLVDICMPELLKKNSRHNVREYIEKYLEDSE